MAKAVTIDIAAYVGKAVRTALQEIVDNADVWRTLQSKIARSCLVEAVCEFVFEPDGPMIYVSFPGLEFVERSFNCKVMSTYNDAAELNDKDDLADARRVIDAMNLFIEDLQAEKRAVKEAIAAA